MLIQYTLSKMDIIQIIGLIGSILSITAAIASFNISKKIKKTKEEIYAKIRISNYTELEMLHRNSINQLRLITLKDKIGRGVNTQDIIATLHIFLENLNQFKNALKTDGFEKIDEFINVFKKEIIELEKIDVQNYKNLKEKCNDIYYHLIENKEFFNDSKRKL